MGEVSFTPFVFEPHNGYGAKDPDGEPWPFGYISEGYGRPLFELRPVVVHPYEKLHDAALKMTAARDLYEALKLVIRYRRGEGEFNLSRLPPDQRGLAAFDLWQEVEAVAIAALSKASQKGEG